MYQRMLPQHTWTALSPVCTFASLSDPEIILLQIMQNPSEK